MEDRHWLRPPSDHAIDRTVRPLPDPFVWHTERMVSTWEFYGFRGRVNVMACERMWSEIVWRAARNVHRGRGDLPVMQWPPWKRDMTHSWPADDGQWFDTVIQPRWALTWRMLAEAGWEDAGELGEEPEGVKLVCETQKEVYFNVFARGKLVANGWTIRRRDSTPETHVQRRRLSRRAEDSVVPAVHVTGSSPESNLYVSSSSGPGYQRGELLIHLEMQDRPTQRPLYLASTRHGHNMGIPQLPRAHERAVLQRHMGDYPIRC